MKKQKSKTVKVRISVMRRTSYTSIVEMPREEFEALDKRWTSHDRKVEEEMNDLIDTNDWQDDSLDYVDDFELEEEEE